jgi:hypothetical protein
MAREMNIAIVAHTLVVGYEKHCECWAHLEAIGELGYPNGIIQADSTHLCVEMKKLLVHRE